MHVNKQEAGDELTEEPERGGGGLMDGRGLRTRPHRRAGFIHLSF